MTEIPTKAELAQFAKTAAEVKVNTQVMILTTGIVADMKNSKNSYENHSFYVSLEVERRLKSAFADKGWTLTVLNFRTSCIISWS